MANLSKVIYINEEDYSTLINGGTVTKSGQTYSYDESALYVIKDVSAPEYAETSGYAQSAGTANVAITDASGNNIVQTYGKKPLIIELQDDEQLPQGTFNNITSALAEGRLVYLYVYRASADENTLQLLLTDNRDRDDCYYFSGYCEGSLVEYRIYHDDQWNSNWHVPVYTSETQTIGGIKTFSGSTTFISSVSLGSYATAKTQAAGDNDTSVATTAFVQNAVNALPTPMQFKGSLGTGGTYTGSSFPAAANTNKGWTVKVITDGTYQGVAAKVGDTLISDGTNWILIPSGDEPSGTVTSIQILAESPISVDAEDAITSNGVRTITHDNSGITAGTYKSVTVDAKGHVTAGTNPTTLAGYGITDAASSTHTHYWANLQVGSSTNYITEPEVKSVKINGSTTNTASTENCILQYNTTDKCLKFVFN